MGTTITNAHNIYTEVFKERNAITQFKEEVLKASFNQKFENVMQ